MRALIVSHHLLNLKYLERVLIENGELSEIKEARSREETLAFSGHPENDADDALRLGAAAYLAKNSQPAEIAVAVRMALERKFPMREA